MARTKDMTSGKPWKIIFLFALPLMVGNVFQQLYTVVDTMIVGQGIGVGALAALGAADWINWLIIGTVSGVTQGFSILYAQLFGGAEYSRLRQSISTSVVLAIFLALVITAVSEAVLLPLLRLLNTPDDILPMTAVYLRIMMAGTPIVMAYNLAASILRSLGDGRTPLIAMAIACAINIVLDLLFILVFRWGVAGAAIATLTAQAFSSLFCLMEVRRIPVLQMAREEWKYQTQLGRKLLKLGLPLAFQGTIISVGGMIVQMVVNTFGVLFIAGFTAVNKLYGILEIAATSFGYAILTYAGQNLGAGDKPRIVRGVRQGAVLSIATSLVIAGVMLLFGKTFLAMFISGTAEEVATATSVAWTYLRIMAAFLPVLYILYVYRSALQGLGDTVIPMVSGIVEFVMRVSAALILPHFFGEIGIFFAEVAAWTGAAVLLFCSYCVRIRKV